MRNFIFAPKSWLLLSSLITGSLSASSEEMQSPVCCEEPRCCAPYFTADFIFWKSVQDGLLFAQSGLARTSTQPATKSGKIEDVDFDYIPGFKVGAGLYFPRHDDWDLYAQYTWLSNQTDRRQLSPPSETILVNTWFMAFPGAIDTVIVAPLSQVIEKWHQHFNMLDLELGKQCLINRYLNLRPYAGFKLASVDQTFKLIYSASVNGDPISPYHIKTKQDFSGVGIRVGCDSSWTVYKNLAINAEI